MTIHEEINQPNIDKLGWLQQRAPKRYGGMDGLQDYLKGRSEAARTSTVKNKDIVLVPDEIKSMEDINKLSVQIDGVTTGLSHWSFGQLASLAGIRASELRKLPAPIVADAMHWCLQNVRKVEDVKAYFDGSEARAFTGPSYGRVDDWQVVEALRSVLDTGRWVPATGHMGLSVTDRALHMFLIDEANPIVVGKSPRGGDRVVYRGLKVSNSETGFSSLTAEGFMFDTYCTNGCIFGRTQIEAITVRHTSGAPMRWAAEVAPAIDAYVEQDGTALVDHVQKLKQLTVASDDDKAVEFLNRRAGLTITQARGVLERVEAEEDRKARTMYDMINGITALARSSVSAEARIDMERTAGKLWDKVA